MTPSQLTVVTNPRCYRCLGSTSVKITGMVDVKPVRASVPIRLRILCVLAVAQQRWNSDLRRVDLILIYAFLVYPFFRRVNSVFFLDYFC